MRSASSREQAYQAPVNPHSSRLSKVCPPVNRRPVSLPLFTRQSCFSLLGSGFFQERHSKKLKPVTIDAMTSNHHISVTPRLHRRDDLTPMALLYQNPTRPFRSGARALRSACPAGGHPVGEQAWIWRDSAAVDVNVGRKWTPFRRASSRQFRPIVATPGV